MRHLANSLRPTRLVAHLITEGVRRLLNPGSTTSYAQTGEDILIASLLGWPTSGIYVDIGCNHPVRLSNTYLLYLRGLKGVCVDANPEFASDYIKFRPLDTFIHACVSDTEDELLFTIFKDPAISSIGGWRAPGLLDAQYEVERVLPMRPARIDWILAKANTPRTFELLSIDVEGHDFSALRSVDLLRYKPKLIVIELHGVDVTQIESHEVSQYLHDFDYRVVAVQRSNAFFMYDPVRDRNP